MGKGYPNVAMRALPLISLLLLPSCGWVNFSRNVSNDELRLRSEVRAYYDEVARAFASGNAEALSRLYDRAIARPMNREQILDWARIFFAQHGRASFKIDHIEFERLGYENAVVVLRYRVETSDGRGGFSAIERSNLVKRGRRWVVTSWEKIPPIMSE